MCQRAAEDAPKSEMLRANVIMRKAAAVLRRENQEQHVEMTQKESHS
jgi:hypothetical protein